MGAALTLALSALLGSAHAVESGYPPTPVGEIEVKTLPAVQVLEASGAGTWYEPEGSPFRLLFRYLRANDLSMTSPVEVDVADNRMRFLAGSDASGELRSQGGVEVWERATLTVVSVGLRGAYTPERYQEGVQALEAWIDEHPEWSRAGPPKAIFWDAPFVPGPLKRSEVHVPVRPAGT